MPANVDSMAYAGQTPWHGLGNKVPETASIEEMQVAAGLTWSTKVAALSFKAGSAHVKIPRRAMYRDDTNGFLDIVGPEYIPAQNDEVLEFFREYLASGDMTLETAGALDAGRYVWGLGKLKVDFTLPGGDRVEGYLLVCNPNIYGKGLIVKFVMTRVVCQNTLTGALNETGQRVTIAHIRKFDAETRAAAKEAIGLATDAVISLKKEAEAFANLRLTDGAVDSILQEVFGLEMEPDPEQGIERVRHVPTTKRIKDLYLGAGIGSQLESAAGTAWGLLNAVTQYVDHEQGKTADARLKNAWFGQGQVRKDKTRQAIWKSLRKS